MTLEILTSELLGDVRHGFFTRRGGASSGVFSGLNCGLASSDQDQMVRINRTRVAEAMDVPTASLVTIRQTHSPDVITVTEPIETDIEGDALVTREKGLALGILTADCQPVLFSDHDAGVIGAAHAGWKGARAGVLENTLEAMVALGASRENIVAVIGPTISQPNYEVGPEFLDDFLNEERGNDRFFASTVDDRAHFDLPAYGLYRLNGAGIGHAEWTHHCTYADPDRFFSFRRATHNNEADYGRLISSIRL